MNPESKETTTPTQAIVIIGGGPVGLACAIAARRAAIPYLVIEKGCLVN